MPLVIHLRVTSPILAVATARQHPEFVTIPTGAAIETLDDLREPGLHHVTFEERNLLAFTRDLRERTEQPA